MARKCESDGFIAKTMQTGKLKDEDMIIVSVTDLLSSCVKINTRTINKALTGIDETVSVYNAANVPVDTFGCSKNQCYNTGTFQGPVIADGAGAGNSVIIGDFLKTFDAALYTGGIVTAYVLLPQGEHNVSLEIANYTEQNWTNSNVISKTVHATQGAADGSYLYPVTFYLGDLSDIKGTGWTGGSIGAVLRIIIDGANLKVNDLVGVSSFAFYESLDDLKINNTILFKCINTMGDNQNFDVIESQCNQTNYDTSAGQLTFSITSNQYSPNYRYLNPTWYEDPDTTERGLPHVVTRTVRQGEGELADYGVIQLSDMQEGSCGDLYVQTPGCSNNSSALSRVSSPVPVAIAETDFQVLTQAYNGIESAGVILVDKQWVGQDLNVIYMQKHNVKASKVTNEFREFNVTIMAPFRKQDKTIEYHYYENALMTVDVNSISRTDETPLELQFTVAADENGVKKRIFEKLD